MTGKKRVLCIWGQGGGYGHAARLFSIARALEAAGFDVHLALKDPKAAQPFAVSFRGGISTCPVYRPVMALKRHQASLADLMLLSGFADPQVLTELQQAWKHLIIANNPDTVIVDHAPAALLAVRGMSCQVLLTGNPFVTPAPGHALADWRPDLPADKLVSQTEALVLRNINSLPEYSARPLERLSDLFSSEACLLTCYPILDSLHEQRRNTRYCAASLTAPVAAAATEHYEIVCYLKSGFRRLELLALALAATGRSVLMVVPGLDESKSRQWANPQLQIRNTYTPLEPFLASAGLFIGHGNLNSLNQCLRLAIPMLLLPLQMENLNHAMRLRQAGLARVAAELQDSREYREMIEAALTDSAQRQRLLQHAASHRYAGEASVGEIFRQLLSRAT